MPPSEGMLGYMNDLRRLEFSNTYRMYESKLQGLRDVELADGSIHKVNAHNEDVRYIKVEYDPVRSHDHSWGTYYLVEGVWMRYVDPRTQIVYDPRTRRVQENKAPGSTAASISHRKAAIYRINRRQWMEDHGGVVV